MTEPKRKHNDKSRQDFPPRRAPHNRDNDAENRMRVHRRLEPLHGMDDRGVRRLLAELSRSLPESGPARWGLRGGGQHLLVFTRHCQS
ncbi:unnamed protein product [Darwinula stevensoni]|uniref:Uncharacterized protein n=1 Tax=Darwinula stevensoni TaxID=69355 RepID=A0A7R9A7N1_9CRUS|nr:unnamed protein product [Darwinula stevensoni]CAG0894137.1 unnamed protein product [Darwinula stevensoni]